MKCMVCGRAPQPNDIVCGPCRVVVERRRQDGICVWCGAAKPVRLANACGACMFGEMYKNV